MARLVWKQVYYLVVCLLIACGLVYWIVDNRRQELELQDYANWPHVTGVLTSAKVHRKSHVRGGYYFGPRVSFRYEVGGREYRGDRFSPATEGFWASHEPSYGLDLLDNVLGPLSKERGVEIADRELLQSERPVTVFYSPEKPGLSFIDHSRMPEPDGPSFYAVMGTALVCFIWGVLRSAANLRRMCFPKGWKLDAGEPEAATGIEPAQGGGAAYRGPRPPARRQEPPERDAVPAGYGLYLDPPSIRRNVRAEEVSRIEMYEKDIGCWAVSMTLRSGECIRTAVSSREDAERLKARLEAGEFG